MAVGALLNAQIYAGSIDLTGTANRVSVAGECEVKDATTFATAGYRTLAPGLLNGSVEASGFYETSSTSNDPALWSGLGSAAVVTVGVDSTAGSTAYLANPVQGAWGGWGTTIGELAPWSAAWWTQTGKGLARGRMLIPAGTSTATSSTSGVSMGAATAQTLVAHLHVFAGSGTLDVAIKSKSSSGSVASGSTSRLSFTQATAATSERKTTTVTTTDTYWGITYTIGGGSPSFTFAVALAIV